MSSVTDAGTCRGDTAVRYPRGDSGRGWRFCPRCRAELTNDGAKVECSACGFERYANALPAVAALVVDDDGRMLLARRAHEPDAGLWDTLGGFLEEDEDPLDGSGARCARRRASRSTSETSSARIRIATATARMPRWRSISCGKPDRRALAGDQTELVPADDVSELRWFARDDLPGDDELAFRWLARCLDDHVRRP